MKKGVALLVVALLFFSALGVSANSAEPPGIIILVPLSDPTNLEIKMTNTNVSPSPIVRFNQLQYNFYNYRFEQMSPVTFQVNYGTRQFSVAVEPSSRYNNIYSLDLAKEVLTVEVAPAVQFLIISGRILLTLFLEGLVLFLFGFRQRRSWLCFLVINLITQAFLNISLSRAPIFSPNYWVIGMAIYEILILVAEMILFALIVKEHTKWRRVCYVFISNLVSFFVGMQLIMWLPI